MAALPVVVPTFTDHTPEPDSRFLGFEPFVDERIVAAFLGITPRHTIELARKGEIPAHPIGHQRKTWRFRISEISAFFTRSPKRPVSVTISAAVPGATRSH